MRSAPLQQPADCDVRRRLGRLDGLPLRPATARLLLAEVPDESDDRRLDLAATPRWRAAADLDPGWQLAVSRHPAPRDPLAVLAERPWWPATSRDAADALTRLWRHDVAVSLAARRLAREADDPDPDLLGRAGLLASLGLWAAAAVEPEWLAGWLAEEEPDRREGLEVRDLGAPLGILGRNLAERWGCDRLVADACWLLDEPARGLRSVAGEPGRVAVLQDAYRLAEFTPWSLTGAGDRPRVAHDPRVKLLTAEVQARCAGVFLDADAGPREEQLTRANARLRLRVEGLAAALASRDRFLTALAVSSPSEPPDAWAERAGLALCAEPGVSAARVDWEPSTAPPEERPPALQVPLGPEPGPAATLSLWTEPGRGEPLPLPTALDAWRAWAGWVADRHRLNGRCDAVAAAYRRLAATEETRLRAATVAALAEFAAGAGHELNNPLAVIVGRAQLLLARETDAQASRSLRTILGQAQRAHRILRDLMYFARPPEPRLRFCQPDDILRASARDAKEEADAREVRLVAEPLGHGRRVWADPDGLRHLADALIRNALEATPKGGQVRLASRGDGSLLRWFVEDSGRGLTATEAEHLFDPFFCGRAAGRGLGMGLPRAARFVGLSGGEIRPQSVPGQGSTFVVRLPLAEPPKPPAPDAEAPGPGPAAGGNRPTAA